MLPEARHGVKRKIFIQICRGWCLWVEYVNLSATQNWCEALYDTKAAELILYGRALGLAHSEAEDVLQETFVALMQLSGPPTKPEHYCVRSYRNRALNYRRSFWRRLTREWESCHWFEKTPETSPAEQQAMQALAQLPAEQREVIVLKVWHGCTFEEIGGLLEISANTAAGRYRYGLRKMRTEVEGLEYETDELERGATAFLASTPGLEQA